MFKSVTQIALHKKDRYENHWANFRAWANQKLAEFSKRREHCNFESTFECLVKLSGKQRNF